jgi:hypothetical protein
MGEQVDYAQDVETRHSEHASISVGVVSGDKDSILQKHEHIHRVRTNTPTLLSLATMVTQQMTPCGIQTLGTSGR